MRGIFLRFHGVLLIRRVRRILGEAFYQTTARTSVRCRTRRRINAGSP